MTETAPDRLLSRRAVELRAGLSRSTLYRMMRVGAFPEPFRIGPGAVRWSSAEVERWIAALPRSHGDRAA